MLGVVLVHAGAGAGAVVRLRTELHFGVGQVVDFGAGAQTGGRGVIGNFVLAVAANHAHQNAVLTALAGDVDDVLAAEAVEAHFLGFGGLEGAVEKSCALRGVGVAGAVE